MKLMVKLRPEDDYVEINEQAPLTVEQLAEKCGKDLPYRILTAKVNGKNEELTFPLRKDSMIELLDMRNHSSYLAYQHSLSLIYLKAVKDVLGDMTVEIDNSLNKGLYTEIKGAKPVTAAQVRSVESRMRELVRQDLPIVREVYPKEEAIRLWDKYNYPEKSRLLEKKSDVEEAKFYRLEGYRNFFYGLMVPSTGYIELFELRKYRRGVLLRFPYPTAPDRMPEYVDDKKLYLAFGEAKRWEKLLNISYLEDLNGDHEHQSQWHLPLHEALWPHDD